MTLHHIETTIQKYPTFALHYEPDEEAVREVAYQLWQEAGEPSGNDLHFWFEAKKILDLFFWNHCTEDIIKALQGTTYYE